MKKLGSLIFLAMIIGIPQNDVLASCINKTFSGLPHSFGGVARCNRQNEWEREAQNRCLAAARQRFGSQAGIQLNRSPFWKGSYNQGRVCTQYVLGQCVDTKRECSATFSRLTCYVKVCY